MEKTKPSIIEFIFSTFLSIILVLYSIRELSDFILYIFSLYIELTEESSKAQRKIIILNELYPPYFSIGICGILILYYYMFHLGNTISYFKKLKFINLKINSNEFNTCSSCNHDQVHFHAISCPKCGSPEVNMFIKEMKRNLGWNIVLFTVIIISTSGYFL